MSIGEKVGGGYHLQYSNDSEASTLEWREATNIEI